MTHITPLRSYSYADTSRIAQAMIYLGIATAVLEVDEYVKEEVRRKTVAFPGQLSHSLEIAEEFLRQSGRGTDPSLEGLIRRLKIKSKRHRHNS